MKLTSIIMLATSVVLVSCGQQDKKKEEKMSTGIDSTNMNKAIKPGVNFFEFANGGWMKKNPIPDGYSRYGAFEVLGKKNEQEIKSIIEELSAKKEVTKGTPEQQIRDYYNAGMDSVKVEELGATPIKPIIDEIKAITNKSDLVPMQVKLNMMGSFPFFGIFSAQDDKNSTAVLANFDQGGLGLPDRDYYTKTDDRSVNIRAEYVKHISKLFQLYGEDQATSDKIAKTIMTIETNLAKVSMTRLEQRDPNATYNILSLKDIQSKYKGYDFETYLKGLGLTNVEKINVREPIFFKNMAMIFNNTNLEDLKTYFVWNVLDGNAGKLSSAFVNESFHFNGTILSGVNVMKPRWKRMIGSTNSNLGDPVGKMYVEKYFPAKNKESMIELVSNLRLALKESIENLDWMSPETKAKAEEKLAAINLKVGYPNKWIDYSSVEINPDTYIQNTWACDAFGYRRDLNKIGKPVDREEWGMTPQTVNAYYSPNMNEIVFPAAILQPPFFDLNADAAVNYGAIGVVIGHEMTHGFDDQGRLYDKDGNLNDWWTPADADKYKAKTKIIEDEYSAYKVLDSLHVNGALTIGENIADNGGLYIAYAALQKYYAKNGVAKPIDGLTPDQRFLISYAQLWRQNIQDKALMRQLQEDVHSPGEARVNVGVTNLPWWYSAFNITESDPSYVAPENRAKIW